MRISIIGASGNVGKNIAIQLLEGGFLQKNDCLQLEGGNPQSCHPHLLLGFKLDLQEAFCLKTLPEIEIASSSNEVFGDLIVFTAGKAAPTDPKLLNLKGRDVLGEANAPLFEHYAQIIKKNTQGRSPYVLIVTNPVELGVAVFSQYFPHERVVGTGALLDSRRFQLEIAKELKVPPSDVRAGVIGEHGGGMIPLWSRVFVEGVRLESYQTSLKQVIPCKNFHTEVKKSFIKLAEIFQSNPGKEIPQGLLYMETLPPDLRTFLRPIISQYSDGRTAVATSHITIEIIRLILSEKPGTTFAQFYHAGEEGINGAIGVELLFNGEKFSSMGFSHYTFEERGALFETLYQIQLKINHWSAFSKS